MKGKDRASYIRLPEVDLKKALDEKKKGFFWGKIEDKWYLITNGAPQGFKSLEELQKYLEGGKKNGKK